MAGPLLTADDIRFRKFTPVRFREGYEPDEVDDFLEEVIATVEELTRIAQMSATQTGSFPTVSGAPSMTEINNNPVVLGLRAENQQLKQQLEQARNSSAQNGGQGSDSDYQQLLADNREMAQRLSAADAEIASLKSAAGAQLAAGSGNSSEAVAELQRLTAELNSLRHDYDKVKAENSGLDEQIKRLGTVAGTENGQAEALKIELEQVRKQLDESNSHIARLQVKLQSKESTDTGSFAAIKDAASSVPNQSTAMLNMAQQLHDEYVQKGKNEKARIEEEARVEKDQTIQAAKSEHDRLVKEAQEESAKIIADAKSAADETYESLAKERVKIERKIDDLRLFEKDYRERLKKFLGNLIDEVQSKEDSSDDVSDDSSRSSSAASDESASRDSEEASSSAENADSESE